MITIELETSKDSSTSVVCKDRLTMSNKRSSNNSGDSPINFEDELDAIRPKKSRITRAGRVLGRSVVAVFRSTTPDAVKDVWRLAQWETTNVRCWRTLIFFLLLITGAFVSSYTFVFLRREQDSDFEANVSYHTV